MIEINRRSCSVAVKTLYFVEQFASNDGDSDLVRYVQCAQPREDFEVVRTLQVDLRQSASDLFSGLGKSTRHQINRASKQDGLSVITIDAPNKADLEEFRRFYNEFARAKRTSLCGRYHLQTLKLLAARNAIVLSKILDSQSLALCYHVYVVDHKRAMLLYSGSHFRRHDTTEARNDIARANRLLHWNDMLWCKQRGLSVYDCGGLTQDAGIAEFKRSFGGREVAEYSGYVAHTWKGRLALRVRGWRS